MVYKGYQPHYQWIDINFRTLEKNEKICIFDKSSVDLAL